MNFKIASNTIIYKGSSILLGKRKKVPYKGEWSLPGGHLESGESTYDCAERELAEETGISLKWRKLFFIVEEITKTEQYYHYFFYNKIEKNKIEYHNNEPNNFEEWRFFSIKRLPRKILKQHKIAINYFIKSVQRKKIILINHNQRVRGTNKACLITYALIP